MPVIRTLGNPGFRDRHWENVSNTVGFPVKGGSNLFQILDMGLDEYVAKFEKISDAATKEFNLEKSMEQMVEEWSDMVLPLTVYHNPTAIKSLIMSLCRNSPSLPMAKPEPTPCRRWTRSRSSWTITLSRPRQ